MQAFFNSPMLKAILAFLALLLAGLVIWFIGPLLAFGEMHPLSSVSMRVTLILLLGILVILFLLEWPKSMVGVAALSLLIWHAGPLFAFGSAQPLNPVWVRVTIILTLVLLYAAWGLYTLWQLILNDEAFVIRMRRPDGGQSPAKNEIKAIGHLARKAASQLKQMHMTMAGGTGSFWRLLRRVVEGKRYLYELPWYMIIGNPGAGKTTVLLNSGLNFPVSEQPEANSAKQTLARNTGTQHCVWWFANNAVLIDTSGRYTAQDDGKSAALMTPPITTPPDEKETEKVSEEKTAEQGKEKAKQTKTEERIFSPQENNRAEWLGFLRVLRQTRARAPVNGALLTVDVAELLSADNTQLMAHAANLRNRLMELRQELGIRFPVYVVLTKTDVLSGFTEYFSSLTSEGRAQVWGFTLPWQGQVSAPAVFKKKSNKPSAGDEATENDRASWPLAQQLSYELDSLQRRLQDGVAGRLQEEFELDRRQALYLLPHEFSALQAPLVDLLEAVFSDSRFDTTQLTHMLRGVYLTSAQQTATGEVIADRHALVPRLRKALSDVTKKLSGQKEDESGRRAGAPVGMRSYFISDALNRIVFPEAHLVKPNLKWEARLRLLRLVGHALTLVTFLWIAGSLVTSYENNRIYLEAVGVKTDALANAVRQELSKPDMQKVPDLLTASRLLPEHQGLDLTAPSLSYLYGLYSAEPIIKEADLAYAHLQDRLVMPVIEKRLEFVIRAAMQRNDAKLAYDSLRVYLLLHDAKQFSNSPGAAEDVRNWLIKDWQESSGSEPASRSDPPIKHGKPGKGAQILASHPEAQQISGLAQTFNNSAEMIAHLETMFSGKRIVQAVSSRNEMLIRQAREYLDKTASSERLYDRAKIALAADAPKDFTLIRMLGPDASTLFSRASGESLEKGVPGLFTYDGYHDLFAKRLPEMIAVAMADDEWVMGRVSSKKYEKKNGHDPAISKAETSAQIEYIRRLYLTEYSQRWTNYLDDLRLVQTDGEGTLAFELNLLRKLAAPDSPLVRLARVAARETTLSRPLIVTTENISLFDKAASQLEQMGNKLEKNLAIRPEQIMERQYVDDRFGALREVVTGKSEGVAQQGAKPGLETITNVLNEYYTVLVVADTALSSGALPPLGTEAATKLKIEAGKMPAPLREIMLGVGNNGSERIEQGAASILRQQAQLEMDKLVAMMATTVIEPCRRNIAGRYPFADSGQEVAIDEFNAMFAAGGAADEYFTKYLLPLVDTSNRPWRYKHPDSALQALTPGPADVPLRKGPTLTGELLKLLEKNGPNPDAFAQIAQIRDLFFHEAGAKRTTWKGDVFIQTLDPTITELVLDIDGQTLRYAHGPIQPMEIRWPGPRGGMSADITANPRIRPDTSSFQLRGPWAFFKLIERGKVINTASTNRVAVEFMLDNRRAVLNIGSGGATPVSGTVLRNFNCPGRAG